MAARDERLDVDAESVGDKRLKQILDQKQQTAETRQKAKLAPTMNKASTKQAASGFRAALESYVSAVQPTLDDGRGPHYWSGKRYGVITATPPGQPLDLHNSWRLPDGSTIENRPTPQHMPVVGLKSLFEIGDPVAIPFEIERRHELQGKITETHTVTTQIDWGILNEMFIDLNNHIAERGIEIDTTENTTFEI